MLIHIRHALQKELVPDRLLFCFEAEAFHGRLEAFSRWIRRDKGEDDLPETVAIRNGDRLFCQLPAAAGPVCFRLPPVTGDECRIMISPLASLDRQAQSSLRMTPRFSDDGTHIIYTELWIGKRRLLYISPESLVSRSFREDLNRIIRGARPKSLIIDEVHAISEWGGNFRTAYQRIPRMIEDLRRHNPGLSVLAVTAAVGKYVGRDVRAMLGLEDRSLSLRRDFYREGVSHQAVVVQSPEEKEAAYEQLLWRDIPALLAREGVTDPSMAAFPQYRDPYDLFLVSGAADRGNSADAIITERRLMDSGSPHILIHTGMGDSLADWLYRTAEAGKGGHRLHCIRLADLPSDPCEADLDHRGTRIPQCRDQACPFGRASLCDYGKQHHLILGSHPEVRQAFTDTFRTLDRLLSSIDAGDPPARIPLTDGDGDRTALALHRLSLLGVIDIFFVDYRESPPTFKVYGVASAVSAGTDALRLLRYLKKHDISHLVSQPDPPEGLPRENQPDPSGGRSGASTMGARDCSAPDAWLHEDHAAEPFLTYDTHHHLFHRLAAYLPPMLQYVSENLKDMQYRRLWNLKTFMKRDPCRYAGLLGTVHGTGNRWQCRACDRCCPDLAFELESTARAGLPEQTGPVAEFFREWLEADEIRFDRAEAEGILERFADRAEDLTARAQCLLEDDPCNVRALFLLEKFSEGCDRRRHERDLQDTAARDRKLKCLIRRCERDAVLNSPTGPTGDGDAPVHPSLEPGPNQSGS